MINNKQMFQQLVEILNNEIKFTSAAKAAFQSVDTDNSGEIDLNKLKKSNGLNGK